MSEEDNIGLGFSLVIDTNDSEQAVEDLRKSIHETGDLLMDISIKTEDVEVKAIETTERIKDAVDQTTDYVLKSEFAAYRTMDRVLGTMHSLIGLFSTALDPVTQALLNGIFAAVEGLMAIASAQYSNPWTVAFAIATTAASITLNITGAALVQAKMDAAAGDLRQAQQILNIAHIWGY